MELRQYAHTLRNWLWVIILFGLIAAATAGAISYEGKKSYVSTTIALVNPTQPVLPNTQGVIDTEQLVSTYVKLLTVAPVRAALIRAGNLTAEQASGVTITALREPATTLVDIKVASSDPGVAYQAAQSVVPAFNSSLDKLQQEVPGANPATRLQALVPVQSPSGPPADPVSPQPLRDALIGLVAGLVLGVSVAFLLENLDNTIKNDYDIRLKLNLPLLGAVTFVPQDPGEKALALMTAKNPGNPVSEAYRAIRTNLMFNVADRRVRTIVVTSTAPAEGKTAVACNIAAAMAQAGSTVILVDADFRRPDLHKIFGLRNSGLEDLILGRGLDELIHPTDLPNLRVICSGPTPSNPSELLGSTGMTQLSQRLQEMADVVIYDTPPVGAVTDGAVIAARADGVVLVVEQGRASVNQINRSRDTLQAVGARILGVVLNKLPPSEAADYYVQYYGYEGDDSDGKRQRGRRRKGRPTRESRPPEKTRIDAG